MPKRKGRISPRNCLGQRQRVLLLKGTGTSCWISFKSFNACVPENPSLLPHFDNLLLFRLTTLRPTVANSLRPSRHILAQTTSPSRTSAIHPQGPFPFPRVSLLKTESRRNKSEGKKPHLPLAGNLVWLFNPPKSPRLESYIWSGWIVAFPFGMERGWVRISEIGEGIWNSNIWYDGTAGLCFQSRRLARLSLEIWDQSNRSDHRIDVRSRLISVA